MVPSMLIRIRLPNEIKANYRVEKLANIGKRACTILAMYCGNTRRKVNRYASENGMTNVTRFAKTRHNYAFMEIQIFVSVGSIYLKLCSVVISMLYCKYFSGYKARYR